MSLLVNQKVFIHTIFCFGKAKCLATRKKQINIQVVKNGNLFQLFISEQYKEPSSRDQLNKKQFDHQSVSLTACHTVCHENALLKSISMQYVVNTLSCTFKISVKKKKNRERISKCPRCGNGCSGPSHRPEASLGTSWGGRDPGGKRNSQTQDIIERVAQK